MEKIGVERKEIVMKKINVNISASMVGAYYDHECPRYMAYKE